MKGYTPMNPESPSCLNKMSAFIFNNPILPRVVGIGSLMKNAIGSQKILNGWDKYSQALSRHKIHIGAPNFVLIS